MAIGDLVDQQPQDRPLIRTAARADLERLREIERAAGVRFGTVGMSSIADDEPPTVEELERHRAAGLAWVAVDRHDRAVAYLIAEPLDGDLHVAQVSVHPDWARRGIGCALLDRAAAHAVATGRAALTLTTFEHVPWNAPYYSRCGFRVLDDRDLTPGLRAVRAHEAALGLDRWPRVCMRRELPAPG